MNYSISLKPSVWGAILIAGLFLMLAPLFLIDVLASSFPEPFKTILTIILVYLVWPIIVAWLYKTKLFKSNKGSMIFYFYVGIYTLFFVITVLQLINGKTTWDTILGALVTGFISCCLILYSIKVKKELTHIKNVEEATKYEIEREESIRRQAEAILLAEKMKENQN